MKSFVSPSLVLEPCLFLPRDFQIGRRHRPPRIGNSRLVRKKFGDKAYRVRRTRILPNGSAFTVETGIPRTNKDINTTCSVDRASIYAAEISFSAGGCTAHACSRTRRTPAIIRLDKRRSTDHTDLSRSRQHLSRFFIVKVPRKILDLALCSWTIVVFIVGRSFLETIPSRANDNARYTRLCSSLDSFVAPRSATASRNNYRDSIVFTLSLFSLSHACHVLFSAAKYVRMYVYARSLYLSYVRFISKNAFEVYEYALAYTLCIFIFVVCGFLCYLDGDDESLDRPLVLYIVTRVCFDFFGRRTVSDFVRDNIETNCRNTGYDTM